MNSNSGIGCTGMKRGSFQIQMFTVQLVTLTQFERAWHMFSEFLVQ